MVFAPDEDARLAGRQLSRLEDAVVAGQDRLLRLPRPPRAPRRTAR